MDENKKKILRDGITMLLGGLIAILSVAGVKVPGLTDTTVGQIASITVIIVSYAVNHYFNHNYSKEAKKAQELKDFLKSPEEEARG